MENSMSEFAGKGFESFPHLYADTKKIAVFAEMEKEILERLSSEYTEFLSRENIMPRAREAANRILDHVMFELAYREGVYADYLIEETV